MTPGQKSTAKWFCSLLIMVLIQHTTAAQEFGGIPFKQRWRQIETDTARIIFAKGDDSAAQRVATLIHALAKNNSLPLGQKLTGINVVLHHKTVIPNGYVGLGPFRSEFYLAPPADNFDQGSVPWTDQLSLHEYRHVHQYNNLRNGVSNVARVLLGQQGYDLVISAAVPNWFFEGDAVYQESRLSPQGRGALPSFLKAYPALWQGVKQYSWMKLRNGSYKDYVPDHYALGYFMVKYGTEKYGPQFWKQVTADATRYKGLLYPWQRAIKQYTGLSYKNFRDSALGYYNSLYKPLYANAGNHAVIPVNSRTVTNYYFPYEVGADSLLYLKASDQQRPGFYVRDTNGEHLLRIMDIGQDRQFGYSNGNIVYTAYGVHARWGRAGYSDIRLLNLFTGKQRVITRKSRMFSPDISKDGHSIIAGQLDDHNRSSLVLLNTEGKILKKVSAGNGAYFSNPRFLDNRHIVTAVRHGNGAMSVDKVDMETGVMTNLLPASESVIGYLSVKGPYVYYTASHGLKDDIFRLDMQQGDVQQLETGDISNYYVQEGAEKLTWSSFTAEGYQLRQGNIKDAVWKNVPVADARIVNGLPPEVGADSGFLTRNTTRLFPTDKYAKLTRPFNFHSWRPNYIDPEFTFTLYGNNVLNTTQTSVTYTYNENELTHAIGADLMYGGLFPYILAGTNYTFNRTGMVNKKLHEWAQTDSYIGLGMPLNWVHGRNYYGFSVSANLAYRADFYKDPLPAYRFSYLSGSIGWFQQVQRARQDIVPRWGYNISVRYRDALNLVNAVQLSARGNLYAPGIVPAHGLVLGGAWQQEQYRNNVFSNIVPYARGYNAVDSAKIATYSAAYHLPLWYPDFGVADILYIQRLRAAVFYDVTQLRGTVNNEKRYLKSAGIELYADTKWWNQYGLTFGIRAGYLLSLPNPNGHKLFYEFLLPVSIIPR